jgi:hypothetical protein
MKRRKQALAVNAATRPVRDRNDDATLSPEIRLLILSWGGPTFVQSVNADASASRLQTQARIAPA